MDKKKNKYKGVIPPPIVPPSIVGALKRGAKLGGRARLKKEPMGPPKSLMQPRLEIRSKPMYDARVTKELVKPRKPRYGAGGTNNPKVQKKKPATKKPVAKKKPKTQAQRIYEEQVKARRRRQKKDPLGRD